MLPSINKQHYFGGIHTAVLVYRSLLAHFPRSRIVLLDSRPDDEALSRFDDHVPCSAAEDGDSARQIVDFSDRYGCTLPVGEGDVWMTTAWWTAYAAQRLAHWQEGEFGTPGKLTYLIQDFEPGFYPWSSQYAAALGTYRPEQDVAIFNTKLLADYFALNGMAFARHCTFEPTINEGLRQAQAAAAASSAARARRIVVYARPSTPRNAFELLCEALRKWGWSDTASANWEVVAVGELKSDLDLGPFKIRALGKMSIEDYAQLLGTSAIGLSMMISPHPSYPPLEMAAFGMGVITNQYANKNLSDFSDNIRSVQTFTPEAIADLIKSEIAVWESRDMAPRSVMSNEHGFLAKGRFDTIAESVVHLMEGE